MSDIFSGNGLCMAALLWELVSLPLVMVFPNVKDWTRAKFSGVRATQETRYVWRFM